MGFFVPNFGGFRSAKNGPEPAQVTSWGVENMTSKEPAFPQGMIEQKQGRVHR